MKVENKAELREVECEGELKLVRRHPGQAKAEIVVASDGGTETRLDELIRLAFGAEFAPEDGVLELGKAKITVEFL